MITIPKKDINLKETIECGQIFRYEVEPDESYTIILNDRVINIKEEKESLIITSNNEKDLEKKIINLLDFNKDYDKINKKLFKLDKRLGKYINASIGLKLLNQPPFEMLLSYIISANNSVKGIQKAVNAIAGKYGTKVNFNNKQYSLFPTPNELSNVTEENFRELRVGFRAKYLVDAVKKVISNQIDLEHIKSLPSDMALNELMQVNGVGSKVASCILMLAYDRSDVFPVDTWVIKTITADFKEIKPIQKEVIKYTKEKYGNYSTYAIQYMFNYKRKEAKK